MTFLGNTNMRKVTLNIEDSLLHALRRKAADTKQSMSELVNDSLEVYFEEYLSNEIVSDTSNHSIQNPKEKYFLAYLKNRRV